LVDTATSEAKQAWSGIIVDGSCFTRKDEKELLKNLILKKMLKKTKVPIIEGGNKRGLNWIILYMKTVW